MAILTEFGKAFSPKNNSGQHLTNNSSPPASSFVAFKNYITLFELRSAFSCLKDTNSPGPDGFSVSWLKISFELICHPLLAIFNSYCLSIGYFPLIWRIANVLTLKKEKTISILCVLSKLFEQIIHARLKTPSQKANMYWFSDNQHGFCAGKSTETAGSALAGLVEANLKKRIFTTCSFLDIKSAFDSAWHPAILENLRRKNCPSYLITIIASFLYQKKAILSDLQIICDSTISWGPLN